MEDEKKHQVFKEYVHMFEENNPHPIEAFWTRGYVASHVASNPPPPPHPTPNLGTFSVSQVKFVKTVKTSAHARQIRMKVEMQVGLIDIPIVKKKNYNPTFNINIAFKMVNQSENALGL